MWINRAVYQDLQRAAAAETAALAVQIARVASLEATMGWLTIHVSRLEHERSILLKNYLGVTVPALAIASDDVARTPQVDSPNHFDDMGDEEAARQGIDWNPLTSEITYNNRA